MLKFVLYISLFIRCVSYLGWTNRVCKHYRQYYLRDKFSPVVDENTILVEHQNPKFKKLKNHVFVQIGSNPKHIEDDDYHWFDGDGMVHGIFL